MSEQGWIALDRGILDHPLFAHRTGPHSPVEAWIWLLLRAAFRDRRQWAVGRVIDVRRGQLIGAPRFLAGQWCWSEGKARRFVARLCRENMVSTETDSGVTVLTVCNYNKYQLERLRTDARPAHDERNKEQGNNSGAGGGDAPPDKFTISREAMRVADALAVACGIPAGEVEYVRGWDGCARWVQACLDANFPADLMIATAKRVARAKRDGPIEHFAYLKKPIERAVLEFNQPPPTVGVSPDVPAQRNLQLYSAINGGGAPRRSAGNGFLHLAEHLNRKLADG